MTLLAIIADDLTGAADAAAPFASQGFTTTISFTEQLLDADVLVWSTESRDGDQLAAERKSRRAVQRITAHPALLNPRWIYKKIDSALRGFPLEELLAVMAELGEVKALVAAALPVETRTTVGGRQYIEGVPLETSHLATPGTTSDLIALFDHPTTSVHSLSLETVRQGIESTTQFLGRVATGIVIADAEHDGDLLILARAALESDFRVLSGSAGFARQLARVLSWIPSGHSSIETYRKQGPVLIIAGSQHQATTAQVKALRQKGVPIVRLSQEQIDNPTTTIGDTTDELLRHLATGRSAVLTTAGLDPSVHGPEFVISRLAEIVTDPDISTCIGGLVLTGGDVAAGILGAMRATAFHLGGEIRPAMPWGIVDSSRLPALAVATKAGSFGTDDALQACLEYLESLGSASTNSAVGATGWGP